MLTNCRLESKDTSQGFAGDNIDISAQDIQGSCEKANGTGFSVELDNVIPGWDGKVVAGALLECSHRCYGVLEVGYIYASNRF